MSNLQNKKGTIAMSMGEWLLSPETWMGRREKFGAIGAILIVLIEVVASKSIEGLHHFTPSDVFQVSVCILMGTFIALPLVFEIKPHDPKFIEPTKIAAATFFLMAAFYLVPDKSFELNGIKIPSAIISTVLDLTTSVLFVVVWLKFARVDINRVKNISERVIAQLFLTLLVVCAIWRIISVIDADPQGMQATRHLLNFLNGAALLGLFSQMLRVLNPPDPVNGLVILLYGCAQIVADQRDCINQIQESHCQLQTPHGVEAYAIAVILLFGKISYGLYFLYCYYAGGYVRKDR